MYILLYHCIRNEKVKEMCNVLAEVMRFDTFSTPRGTHTISFGVEFPTSISLFSCSVSSCIKAVA